MTRFLTAPRTRLALATAFCLLGVAYVCVAGVTREGFTRHRDGRFVWAAGVCWLHGESPYGIESLRARSPDPVGVSPAGPFLYPPTLAAVSIPLGTLPWDTAKRVLDGLNVLALLVCLWFCVRILLPAPRGAPELPLLLFGLGAACFVSGVAATLYLGQTTLIALAGVLGVFHFGDRRRLVPFLLCLVLASIKPQVSLIPLFILFVRGPIRPFLVGGGLLAVLSLALLAMIWHSEFWPELQQSRELYLASRPNQPFMLLGGLQLLDRVGLASWGSLLPVLGLMGAAALGVLARCGPRRHDVLGLMLPFLLAVFLMPLHFYDTALLLPVFAAWPLLGLRWTLLLAPGMALLARPKLLSVPLGLNQGAVPKQGEFLVLSLAALFVLGCAIVAYAMKQRGRNDSNYST